MKKFLKPTILIPAIAILLTACFGPESPQDVSAEFWQAVVKNDAADASQYSTLKTAAEFDAFERDWRGSQLSWGRVVIDGNQASIESTYSSPEQPTAQPRSFTTYLIKDGEMWLVDYDRTASSLNGGVFGELFNTFDRFGKELSKQFNQSSQETSHELERMMEQIDAKQKAISERVTEAMEEYADDLNDILEELEDSINEALQDQQNQLTVDDQQLLQSAVYDLQQSRQALNQDSPLSIASSSLNMAAVQQKLAGVESTTLSEYQQDWQKLIDEYSDDTDKFLQDISGQK